MLPSSEKQYISRNVIFTVGVLFDKLFSFQFVNYNSFSLKRGKENYLISFFEFELWNSLLFFFSSLTFAWVLVGMLSFPSYAYFVAYRVDQSPKGKYSLRQLRPNLRKVLIFRLRSQPSWSQALRSHSFPYDDLNRFEGTHTSSYFLAAKAALYFTLLVSQLVS